MEAEELRAPSLVSISSESHVLSTTQRNPSLGLPESTIKDVLPSLPKSREKSSYPRRKLGI